MTAATPDVTEVLTLAELQRLTLWKHRYVFEAFGFTDAEVCQLMFEMWRWRTNRNRG